MAKIEARIHRLETAHADNGDVESQKEARMIAAAARILADGSDVPVDTLPHVPHPAGQRVRSAEEILADFREAEWW